MKKLGGYSKNAWLHKAITIIFNMLLSGGIKF